MGLDEDDSEYAKLVKVMRPSAVEESLKKLEEKDWYAQIHREKLRYRSNVTPNHFEHNCDMTL